MYYSDRMEFDTVFKIREELFNKPFFDEEIWMVKNEEL